MSGGYIHKVTLERTPCENLHPFLTKCYLCGKRKKRAEVSIRELCSSCEKEYVYFTDEDEADNYVDNHHKFKELKRICSYAWNFHTKRQLIEKCDYWSKTNQYVLRYDIPRWHAFENLNDEQRNIFFVYANKNMFLYHMEKE